MNSSNNKEFEDIDEIFNKHRTNDNNNTTIIQCSFTKEDHNRNNQLIDEYDKAGLIQKKNFYCLEEQEMDNPIKPKAGNNFYESVVKNELENEYLYCGYLDNNKQNSNEDLIQVSCSYCFHVLTINGIETEKGVIMCKKINDVFKDYSEMYNIDEVTSMVKEKAIKEKQLFNERELKEKTLKMFIGIKCIECSNLLGIKDSILDNYILFNCI